MYPVRFTDRYTGPAGATVFVNAPVSSVTNVGESPRASSRTRTRERPLRVCASTTRPLMTAVPRGSVGTRSRDGSACAWIRLIRRVKKKTNGFSTHLDTAASAAAGIVNARHNLHGAATQVV